MAASSNSFTYVHIPADTATPLAELRAAVPSEMAGQDVLLQLLRPRFQGGRIVDVEHLRSEFGADQVEQRMGQLQAMCAEGTVEVFALTRSSKTTLPGPHQSTFLYFDEMGVLKGLPINSRAAAIARECGLDVESPFLGDCFIGRVRILPSPLQMVDFALAELSGGSPWLSCARSENHMYDLAAKKHGVAAARKHPEVATAVSASTADQNCDAASGYSWQQSEEDVDITMDLPPSIGGAKGISVVIEPTKLTVHDQAGGLVRIHQCGGVQPMWRCLAYVEVSSLCGGLQPMTPGCAALLSAQ